MPHLADTYNKYKEHGIQIIAVSMFYDPPSQVLNFIKKNNIPFPVVIDSDNKIAQQFENIRLTPTSILINQKGQIIDQIVGEIDFNKLETTLSQNLY
jgi:peroxiredoxin